MALADYEEIKLVIEFNSRFIVELKRLVSAYVAAGHRKAGDSYSLYMHDSDSSLCTTLWGPWKGFYTYTIVSSTVDPGPVVCASEEDQLI